MGIFGTPRRPATVLDEDCDRCHGGGRVRVEKSVVMALTEHQGEPHAVEVQDLDLVLCGYDFALHEPRLRAQAWQILDDRR